MPKQINLAVLGAQVLPGATIPADDLGITTVDHIVSGW